MDLGKDWSEKRTCKWCSPDQPCNEYQFISSSNDSLSDSGEPANDRSWIDSEDHC